MNEHTSIDRTTAGIDRTTAGIDRTAADADRTAADADAETFEVTAVATLTERDRAMLTFEATWFTLAEDRDAAIRARFQCSPEEYTLELNRVIDHPAAMDSDPLVVRRVRRARDRRRRSLIDQSATGDNANR